MAAASVTVPQPLTGDEVRLGIAVRMTSGLPAECVEKLKEDISDGLRRTCSLASGSCYSKFSADWILTWWKDADAVRANWWVDGKLDDFGRITLVSIGFKGYKPAKDAVTVRGCIEEVPPDRFRRETEQPIPKPVELKKPDEPARTFSRSIRGKGTRRDV